MNHLLDAASTTALDNEDRALSIRGDRPLVPPPDVGWVWLVHQLAPLQYKEDLTELVGRPLPRPLSPWQRAPRGPLANIGVLSRPDLGLVYTDAEYALSEATWRRHCNALRVSEPYFVPYMPAPATLASHRAPPPEPPPAFLSAMACACAALDLGTSLGHALCNGYLWLPH